MGLCENIEIAKRTVNDRNCIGSALFLIGEHPDHKDSHLSSNDVYPDIKRIFQRIRKPVRGCLICWKQRVSFKIAHLGVITNIEPLLVTNRYAGVNGELIVDQPFEQVNEKYGKPWRKIRYYLPPEKKMNGSAFFQTALQL